MPPQFAANWLKPTMPVWSRFRRMAALALVTGFVWLTTEFVQAQPTTSRFYQAPVSEAPPTFAPEADDGMSLTPPGTSRPELSGPVLPVPPQAIDGNDNAPEIVAAENTIYFVSSRRCRQSGGAACPAGQLDYLTFCPNQGLKMCSQAGFLGQLRPDVPIVVVTHGSFTSFRDLMSDVPACVAWLRRGTGNIPLQFVFFTWPSEDSFLPLPRIDLGIRAVRASYNGVYLAQFVQLLPVKSQVVLVGHSHGTRVISSGLHLLGGGIVENNRLRPGTKPVQLRVVFLAAAVDRHWLAPGQRFGLGLGQTQALLNVVNRRDVPLALYPMRKLLLSNVSIGGAGLRPYDVYQLGPYAARYRELDVSEDIGNGHGWRNYFSRPQVAAKLAPMFNFAPAIPANDGLATNSETGPPTFNRTLRVPPQSPTGLPTLPQPQNPPEIVPPTPIDVPYTTVPGRTPTQIVIPPQYPSAQQPVLPPQPHAVPSRIVSPPPYRPTSARPSHINPGWTPQSH